VNGPTFYICRQRRSAINRLAQHIQNSSQRGLSDRSGDGTAGVPDLHAARDTVGAAHRNRANLVLADVLLHFSRQPYSYGAARILDLYRVVDLRQVLRLELYVEHRTDDLHDVTQVALRRRFCANSLCCDCSRHV
jgi:hypothetical protein